MLFLKIKNKNLFKTVLSPSSAIIILLFWIWFLIRLGWFRKFIMGNGHTVQGRERERGGERERS